MKEQQQQQQPKTVSVFLRCLLSPLFSLRGKMFVISKIKAGTFLLLLLLILPPFVGVTLNDTKTNPLRAFCRPSSWNVRSAQYVMVSCISSSSSSRRRSSGSLKQSNVRRQQQKRAATARDLWPPPSRPFSLGLETRMTHFFMVSFHFVSFDFQINNSIDGQLLSSWPFPCENLCYLFSWLSHTRWTLDSTRLDCALCAYVVDMVHSPPLHFPRWRNNGHRRIHNQFNVSWIYYFILYF